MDDQAFRFKIALRARAMKFRFDSFFSGIGIKAVRMPSFHFDERFEPSERANCSRRKSCGPNPVRSAFRAADSAPTPAKISEISTLCAGTSPPPIVAIFIFCSLFFPDSTPVSGGGPGCDYDQKFPDGRSPVSQIIDYFSRRFRIARHANSRRQVRTRIVNLKIWQVAEFLMENWCQSFRKGFVFVFCHIFALSFSGLHSGLRLFALRWLKVFHNAESKSTKIIPFFGIVVNP
jgi:hypothetical protein